MQLARQASLMHDEEDALETDSNAGLAVKKASISIEDQDNELTAA